MAKTLIEAYEEMKEGIGYDELIQTLNYYHIEIQRKRIRCPFPGHNDRHIGNCSITDRGMIYCFACGNHTDAIGLVQIQENMLKMLDNPKTDLGKSAKNPEFKHEATVFLNSQIQKVNRISKKLKSL